ncbi:MAG: nitroreductase family protein [Firmicutes bacterium]|nr:nitroreductase family protein [Bacillota bacterium]
MELLKTMLHRRSVRQYAPGRVDKDKLDLILKAGLSSASGRAIRPWELIVIEDPETLKKLTGAREPRQNMLAEAGAAIAVIADPEKSSTWVEDCSIVMANMHLMADNLGLGSCWIQCRMRMAHNGETTNDFVRGLLGYPDNMQIEAILSIGNLSEHPQPYMEEDLPMDKVHYETY